MTYHENCEAKDKREFGHPVKCIIHHQDEKSGEYQCPACGEVWNIADSGPLPTGLVEK